MLNRLVKLNIALLYFLALRIQRLIQPERALLVLCYHEVTHAQKSRFMRQLNSLTRHAQAVFADAPYQQTGKPRVAISFDDGFENLLDNALPELAQRRMPCTLFIPSACLGKLPPWLVGKKLDNAQEVIMTVKQLCALDKDLIQIGSHSMHHPDLSNLDEATLRQELNQSKQDLEHILQHPVTTLAFPYGRYNQAVIDISRQVNYARIFAADPILHENTFIMGRTTASPDDWAIEFYLKIHGAYQWLPIAIAWKNRLRALLK